LPLTKPVTVHALVVHVAAAPPGAAVATYPVIAEPPSFAGEEKATIAERSARLGETPAGGSGTVAGVAAFDRDDSVLFPTAFVACIVNVYAVPFARPVTSQGLVPQDALVPPGAAVTR
jgi:hypothetical protein